MIERNCADSVRDRATRHAVDVRGRLVVLRLAAVPRDVQVVLHERRRSGRLVEDVLPRHEQPTAVVEERLERALVRNNRPRVAVPRKPHDVLEREHVVPRQVRIRSIEADALGHQQTKKSKALALERWQGGDKRDVDRLRLAVAQDFKGHLAVPAAQGRIEFRQAGELGLAGDALDDIARLQATLGDALVAAVSGEGGCHGQRFDLTL